MYLFITDFCIYYIFFALKFYKHQILPLRISEMKKYMKTWIFELVSLFNREMEGFWIYGAIHAIKALSYMYDLLTFPVYLILQRPWEKRKASRRIKARPISKDDNQITYRSVDSPKSMHIMLEREKVDTLEKVLLWVVKMHGDKRCLGTRQILAEEDEPQPNGRIFKKVT